MTDNTDTASNQEFTPQIRKSRWRVWLVNVAIGSAVVVLGLALLLPATRRAGPAAFKLQCLNNIRNVGLALDVYGSSTDVFPPSYTVDATGQPLHSWRTAILPALDAGQLYQKIDRTKAWDDPTNAEIYSTSLQVYHCPKSDCPKTHTVYMAIVGTNSFLHPTKSRNLSEITDGQEQTLMMIEVPVDRAVHWMAPVDADEELVLGIGPNSRTAHSRGVNVVMANGSARFLSVNVDRKVLRALMTIDANDSVGSNW